MSKQRKNHPIVMQLRVQAYPPPVYGKMIKGMARETGISQSEVVTRAVKAYFDSMPESERQNLLRSGSGSNNHY
jgi:hypothetical protein